MARRVRRVEVRGAAAVSEAITRATTPADLLQSVCDAAVGHGEIGCAGVLLVDADGSLRQAAGAGEGLERLRALKLPADPTFNAGEGALIPIMRGGSEIGVFAFYPDRSGAFSDPAVELLKRLVENVSSALENFDRGDDRRLADEQKERLTRMFAALSATNEAIMRARRARNCSNWSARPRCAAADSPSPSSPWPQTGKRFSEYRRDGGTERRAVENPATGDHDRASRGTRVERNGVSHAPPCISNDYLADERAAAFHDKAPATAAADPAPRCRCSAAANAVGVLLFLSGEVGAFTTEARRTSAAARGQRLLRARELRSSGRASPGGPAKGTPHPDVHRAERDQRSHHARPHARVNCSSWCARRPSTAASSPSPRSLWRSRERTSCARSPRPDRPRSLPGTVRTGDHVRPSRGARGERNGVSHASAVHQQRLSRRRTGAAFHDKRAPGASNPSPRCPCSATAKRWAC